MSPSHRTLDEAKLDGIQQQVGDCLQLIEQYETFECFDNYYKTNRRLSTKLHKPFNEHFYNQHNHCWQPNNSNN